MDNRAIGVFDSGLGGLTTVRELRKLLPDERIVYFGDTGRVPYGNRSRETIRKYAMQDIRFLKRHEVKLVIAGLRHRQLGPHARAFRRGGRALLGVVVPSRAAACAATVNGRIGVIGTTATVRSGAYGRSHPHDHPDARTFGNACPSSCRWWKTALSSRTTRSPRRSRKSTSSP